MASGPYDARTASEVRTEAPARRERSLGEHIFVWIAWALAAAFWGATMSGFLGILRSIGARVPTVSAPGAPGGMGYLALVVVAFVVMGLVMLYAELRTARRDRFESPGETGTAALYDGADRRAAAEFAPRPADRSRSDQDLR